MSTLRSSLWRILWALFALSSLTGCGMLRSFGRGLTDAFKGFKMP